MAIGTTHSSPTINASFSSPFLDDLNTSSSTNNNASDTNNVTGAGSTADSGSGLALFTLPQIPAWVSSLYLAMLCLSILLGVPGNLITVAAYARIKVGH
ncbi:hypothetical protein ElyMa_006783400 [Elysia marginata]|uniref:G-protein coupled receptors family 1 profile domain-containing protein n=1 Tax=Elysia marginata TaxID=1093978 RepID=A0AAV4J5T5_9GAST|nr:hypothetical protein ElyMa_006783400 [Elysia marginata]